MRASPSRKSRAAPSVEYSSFGASDAIGPRALKVAQTRRQIVLTAERMFGELGLEAVSLRKIAEAAGQGNNNAVQYHFKTKRGLIEAILASRAELITHQVQERMVRAAEEGKLGDLRTLLEINYLPVAELTDERGRHTYARFIIQFLLHFERWKDLRLAQQEEWIDRPVQLGVGGHPTLLGRIRAVLPAMPDNILKRRLSRGAYLLLSEVVAWENDPTPARRKTPKAEIVDDVMMMIVGGIGAGYPAAAAPRRS